MVKQKMARVDIDILGMSELKQTMGEFNSDNHISTTVGKNPLEETEQLKQSTDSPKCSTCVQSQRWQNAVHFQSKPFNITVIQPHATVIQPQIPKKLKLTGSMKTYNTFQNKHKNDVFIIIAVQNAKVGSQQISELTGKLALKYKKRQSKG